MAVIKKLLDLPTPSLLLDLDVLERNVARMAARAKRLGVALRPHWKTHKCPEIAALQRDAGAIGGTVSTLEEARAFAAAGHRDLTWALPLILGRLDEARALLEEGVTLRLVVDGEEAVAALEASPTPFRVWLEVDTGYGRTGVDPRSERAVALARRLDAAPHLVFDGLLSHCGHAYHAPSPTAIRDIAEADRAAMVALAERLRGAGVTGNDRFAVSVGSTPSMSLVADGGLEGVDEARPGNYVFYDFMQVRLGACRVEDCALTVLASVVSCQPGAGHAVVDAGALALSKDPGYAPGETMGEVLRADGTLDPELRVVSVTQEHGILSRPLAVGDKVRILPNHSCLTAACFDRYNVVRGDEVVDRWTIRRERGPALSPRAGATARPSGR